MNIRYLLVLLLLALAALTRILPHPMNFAPITAIALFGGACFPRAWQGFVFCLGVMLLSDAYLGFHASVPFVYGSFLFSVGMGLWLRRRRRFAPIVGMTLLASVQFFLVTNFGSWLVGHDTYPRSLEGLMTCFAAGIPFFRNTLAGDAFFVLTLFGTYALLERRVDSHDRLAAVTLTP